jgi:hypothetical protein
MEKKARLSSPMLPHLRLRFLRIVSLGYRETSRSLRIGASFWLILSCLYFKRHFYLCLYRFLLMQLTFYIYIYIYIVAFEDLLLASKFMFFLRDARCVETFTIFLSIRRLSTQLNNGDWFPVIWRVVTMRASRH